MPFTCSICGEESTQICARCTKDTCGNHLCEKCLRCSDCCECDVALEEPVRSALRPPASLEPESEPESVPPDPEPLPPEEAEAEAEAEAGPVAP